MFIELTCFDPADCSVDIPIFIDPTKIYFFFPEMRDENIPIPHTKIILGPTEYVLVKEPPGVINDKAKKFLQTTTYAFDPTCSAKGANYEDLTSKGLSQTC